MPVKPSGPLTAAHKRTIDEALYTLNELAQKLDKAEQAGFDVTSARADRDAMHEMFMNIKRVYFPNG